ncbi:TldD/PmbA family protein [Actinomycetospora termitidis]|uniref:TldD/PmbA family protein n=1 Tax=Actinomycetospora termitidis TaxID=3053470 RepID=A0ABT7M4R3_9PSEU|nr:TldD/PmbA family protein [Actinomycetospora sp. Odt1-22]MDL5155022.1 TldD/PmbA family protein [Actinomycetospora sp. Odt1-22]
MPIDSVPTTGTRPVDPDFLALPLRAVADAALQVARDAGAEHADVRVQRLRSRSLELRDARVVSSSDSDRMGLAVRVLLRGVWGFAAHVDVTPATAAATARRAIDVATTLAAVARETVTLAPEPVHGDVTWVSEYDVDPFDVAEADRIGLLAQRSSTLLAAPGVDHVEAGLLEVKEQVFYADLAGTVTTQQRVRVDPGMSVTAVDRAGGGFESLRTVAPPAGRGWEYLTGTGWDWDAELAELPELLAEKLRAPGVEAGPTDLVIDPTNLWLVIHESIGHATEYDRAIGYEANYAGTSFATPDLLGSLRYGSEVLQVTGDRTVPHGLASVGYDDDGVATTEFDLIRDGVLVGYQVDRQFAPRLGLERSNGCAYADSAEHVPLQRMANVSITPAARDVTTADLISGVDDGIYVVGDRSWSIDMQRYNFQFTGQRFYRVRDGELAGQVRDVAYQATTTDFWGALEAVGGPSTWRLGGAFTCGKAQPGQVAPVSHGCPSALFRGINVLNTASEGTR